VFKVFRIPLAERHFHKRGLIALWPLIFGLVFLSDVPSFYVQAAPVPWKVALVLPMTGPKAPVGERLKKGYTLALRDLEKQGIFLEPIWIDEGPLSRKESGKGLEEGLRDPSVITMIGAYSSDATYRLAVLAQKYKIPLIMPSAMADRLTRQGFKWVFRLCPSRSLFLEGFASFLLGLLLSPPSGAILYEDTPWGEGLGKKIKAILKDKGCPSPVFMSYTPGAPEYQQLLERLKGKSFSLIFLISSTADILPLLHTIRSREDRPLIVVGLNLAFSLPLFFSNRCLKAQGLVFPVLWVPCVSWARDRDFHRGYQARYGEDPDYHAAEAYSALWVLAEALRQGRDGTQRNQRALIQKNLVKGHFSTPMGPVEFKSHDGYTHQSAIGPLILQVQDKGPVVVYPPEASTGGIQVPWSPYPLSTSE
jgi:branched-chain amino acid transport system substrate-binding protein